jgi:HEAT repeat protein
VLIRLTTQTYDPKLIEKMISNGFYDRAAKDIFKILRLDSNKETIYKSLSLLSSICDKSPSISLQTIKNIEQFISDSDSWIRLVSMEILYQISIYRPNLLLDLLDKIRVRIYDTDPSVRRITVKLMGNLILSLHIDSDELHHLIEEFNEKLLEDDWKVKFQVIKTIKKILNQDYTKIKDLEPLLSMVIVNLRDKDDDVARAAADLLKILGTYFLSKDKIFYILLNLLYNEEPRVKELIIWLFGEIGKEKSSEIIPIIPKLVKLLDTQDYKIQLKITEALVNIAQNNFDQTWANIINSLETSDRDLLNSLVNVLYHLGQTHIEEIFPYIFDELENPSEKVRKAIALVFKRLFEEYQIEIENEIIKILYNLESKYWRERKKNIILLRNIIFILKKQNLAVWITIEFNKALSNESDHDVREELLLSIDKIKSMYKDINKQIEKIENRLSSFQEKIVKFQKLPAEFRNKLDSYIKDFKFAETDIKLNEMYREILKDLKNFDNDLNNFEFKRLAFDLLEEWEETKVQIIDELGIIKGFLSEIYEEQKKNFKISLENKIKVLDDRIDVLNAQFDYLKKNGTKLNIDIDFSDLIANKDKIIDEEFTYITQIRKNMFKLDVDVRELLINNLEFDDIFKPLIRKWIASKIEIQKYLNDFDNQIKLVKDSLMTDPFMMQDSSDDSDNYSGINKEIAMQLLQGHILAIISHGIDVIKKFNDSFREFNLKLKFMLKKNEFTNVNKLLEMKSTQLQNFISETENQIDRIIGRQRIHNNTFNLFIRPYLDKWNASKELIMNKLKFFNRKFEEKVYLNQIDYHLKIMNPIKLDLLSSYMELDIEHLREILIKFVKKNKLNAKIINDTLFSSVVEEYLHEHQNLLFFKNIKTIGNKIFLHFKLNNPSNYNYKDLQIYFKFPTYLKFLKKESFPKYIHLNDLKTGNVFKFNYVLKIEKNIKKNFLDPSADEINLKVYYKDPFDIQRKLNKKINLLLP